MTTGLKAVDMMKVEDYPFMKDMFDFDALTCGGEAAPEPVELKGADGVVDEAAVRGKYRAITRKLIERGQTITTMESCTSGQVASLITDTEGASAVMKGAFITYSNAAKIQQGVDAAIIERWGVYSARTAAAMARACRTAYGADIGIGVTGSFGNVDPNNADSVPGEVFFAIAAGKGVSAYHCVVPVQPSRLAYKLYMADVIADRLIIRKKLFSEIPYLKGSRIVLKALTQADAPALSELTRDARAYRYLPTFLFEKKYDDIRYVIDHLYDECLKESIILGVFMNGAFCGLAEMYGYRDPIHKISVGYRLLERCWGQGIATEALRLMIDYLYSETDIEIITASTMVENQASANVLRKNGFSLVAHAVGEDWGYPSPTITDKWIR